MLLLFVWPFAFCKVELIPRNRLSDLSVPLLPLRADAGPEGGPLYDDNGAGPVGVPLGGPPPLPRGPDGGAEVGEDAVREVFEYGTFV